MSSTIPAVLLITKALENGLGKKNLTASTVIGDHIFFKLKQTAYAVDICSLEVFKTISDDVGTRLMTDDYSMLTQQYLQNILNDQSCIDKMVNQICVERGLKL